VPGPALRSPGMNRTSLAVVCLLVVVAACGDDSTVDTTTTAVSTTATTTAAGTTVSETTTTTAATTTTDDAALLIEVAVHTAGIGLIVDGLVLESGVRVNVVAGSLVRIITSGEVADEVHVHGYDMTVDVTPGAEETLEFPADIPGIFEVELEDAGTLLFELEVS